MKFNRTTYKRGYKAGYIEAKKRLNEGFYNNFDNTSPNNSSNNLLLTRRFEEAYNRLTKQGRQTGTITPNGLLYDFLEHGGYKFVDNKKVFEDMVYVLGKIYTKHLEKHSPNNPLIKYGLRKFFKEIKADYNEWCEVNGVEPIATVGW